MYPVLNLEVIDAKCSYMMLQISLRKHARGVEKPEVSEWLLN
jgi:hypothetical protein